MKTDLNPDFFKVEKLGTPKLDSPLNLPCFVNEDERVLYNCLISYCKECKKEKSLPLSFELAGPREKIYFDPVKVKAGIVTCGGLCPGINDVIRSIVRQLLFQYKTTSIMGFQYGFEGFISEFRHPVIEFTAEDVDGIHQDGGTILKSSRGKQDVSDIVDTLDRMNINMLFCVGGDGTLRGANEIFHEIQKRNLKISVIGIPKTIDNDISYVEETFGFETAYSIATESLKAAHVEAKGAYNGVGLVQLMGRHSGFIAANATLASDDVNVVLVPECKFTLEGKDGLYEWLEKRLEKKKHAVIVVAEGAGQYFFNQDDHDYDKSGNVKFQDIGVFLKNGIKNYFSEKSIPVNLKYIDPSYIIRSAPANAKDSLFCLQLGQNAVHAAMAGKTGVVVGKWNGKFTYVPITAAVSKRKGIDIKSSFWINVLAATGQPIFNSER